jgi:branched-chain amino acid transport system permease protein
MAKIIRSPFVLCALVCALLPFLLLNAYWWDLAIRIGLNVLLALSLNLLVGLSGQISLGHAAFIGIGAYASAILTTHFGWPPIGAIGMGALASGALAWLIAKPILRLKGYYLAMATLGLGIITSIVLTNESRFTGGPDGMSVPPLALGPWVLNGEKAWYALVAILFVLGVCATRNLINSPFGRGLRALHGSDAAARVMGIDVTREKTRVFVLSAVTASLVGSLMAHYVGFLTPQVSSFLHSIELVTMVVVGGLGSVLGAIVGAIIMTVVPQLLAKFEGFEMVFFGAILILAVVFFPKGVGPTLARKFSRKPHA